MMRIDVYYEIFIQIISLNIAPGIRQNHRGESVHMVICCVSCVFAFMAGGKSFIIWWG